LIPTEAIMRRQAKRIRELAIRFTGFVKEARDRMEPQGKGQVRHKVAGIEACEQG